jgi:hypothetical protein
LGRDGPNKWNFATDAVEETPKAAAAMAMIVPYLIDAPELSLAVAV